MTKTVINYRFRLENSFQQILYLVDIWINKGSGWIVKSIESQYINISTYINLPVTLKNTTTFTNLTYLKKSKKRTNQHQKQKSKMFLMVSF